MNNPDPIRMKLEAELKAYAPDLAAVTAKLEASGADLIGERTEEDVYYAHPGRDFGKTDEALRLRVISGIGPDGRSGATQGCELCYKGPKLDRQSKSREEYSVSIDDRDAVGRILERLGFRRLRTVRKNRKIYRYGDFNICVDDVDGLGSFVEIEKILDSRSQLEEVLSRMQSFLTISLGLDRFERRSYLELLMVKNNPQK